MHSFCVRIRPKSAFGTKLKGDTLFGHLCWAILHRDSENRLSSLLDGYTGGRPFAVVSDAFPAGYLPRPVLPGHWFREVPNADRKTVKKRAWLPMDQFYTPIEEWLMHCLPASTIPGGDAEENPQPHNTLNRHTGTTGEGEFAPYMMNQLWYGSRGHNMREGLKEPAEFELFVILDESRLKVEELKDLLADVGTVGFGRDASIGLGKYEIRAFSAFDLPAHENANAWLTLAPCAPQGLPWQTAYCFYQPFTRFGRHGDVAVHGGNPFKTPVLLADTGAVLMPAEYESKLITGQGLGGDGSLSKRIPGTVHQGYSPILEITLPESMIEEVA